MIIISAEEFHDAQKIREIHLQAFAQPEQAEVVDLVRQAGKAIISLIAIQDNEIVGHILFSPVTLIPDPVNVNGLGLAPLAVLPSMQKNGIGSKLIQAGLSLGRQKKFDYVVVLGDPAYYTRFGFHPASCFGLQNEYGIDERFMVIELIPNSLAGIHGLVKYSPEFKYFS